MKKFSFQVSGDGNIIISSSCLQQNKTHSFLAHAVFWTTIVWTSRSSFYTVLITLVNMSCSREKNTCDL